MQQSKRTWHAEVATDIQRMLVGNSYTTSTVQVLVSRLHPGLPPFNLSQDSLNDLYSRFALKLPWQNIREDMNILSQQACLENAQKAQSENESLRYLSQLIRLREHRLT